MLLTVKNEINIRTNFRKKILYTTMLLSIVAFPSVVTAQNVDVAAQQEGLRKQQFNIPGQALAPALVRLARETGMELFFSDNLVKNINASAVRGNMTSADALAQMLRGTGLSHIISGRSITLQKMDDEAAWLGKARVEGTAGRASGTEQDAIGQEDVYFQDFSTSYLGKKEIERFRGTSSGDILKGMVNVYSGDSRNSGALDPSIRGISGPGRVPVIIDGTEQAMTVWRGYNGITNRSYIDPGLISGMQVFKGPVSARSVSGATGGAVVINTLDADDIMEPGETFGMEFMLEGGNNSTEPHIPPLFTGQDANTIPGLVDGNIFTDPTMRVYVGTDEDNEFFYVGDRAARLAVAGRIGKIDLFSAYAYRIKGNYFAGMTATDYYAQEDLADNSINFIRRNMAAMFEPGYEVPNTSLETNSWLFKGTLRISDEQVLQLSYRDSQSENGEIMPSRIWRDRAGDNKAIQWPLSKVHAKAYSAEYKWTPDNRLLDVKANLWATRTKSNTYSGVGMPNDVVPTHGDTVVNTALVNAQNNRIGFNISNKMTLTPQLDLTFGGNWHHENLSSKDSYREYWASPRAGRREEFDLNFKVEWRPVSFLKFNAGLNYSGYWSMDDFRRDQINSGIIIGGADLSKGREVLQYTSTYQTEEYGEEAYEALVRKRLESMGLPPFLLDMFVASRVRLYMQNPYSFTADHNGPDWTPDGDLRYSRANNPCVNGTITNSTNYKMGSCNMWPQYSYYDITVDDLEHREKRWTPHLSVTAYINDNSRVYLSYAEAYRYPSLFETTVGFSAVYNPLRQNKPEHMRAFEAAYIQDMADLMNLGEGQFADFKLTYYHNIVRDVIERDPTFQFWNLDKQVIAGIEFQARYDNGRFFTNFSAAHMTRNQVCDESIAILSDPLYGRLPDCVKYGFQGGYLMTQASPEDSINLMIGGRFLDRKLEVGGRFTYYGIYKNPMVFQLVEDDHYSGGFNVPYTWGTIVTLDAFASYRFNDRFSIDLSGINLNNRYYMDPLSRALNPAPGRTVRMTITGRF